MKYSKRWELTHILGGKCVDCGNENFYELEIDHINNDGDGERKYYTIPFEKHLRQSERAKKRLQVRCKKCHEQRHHNTYENEDENIQREIAVYPAKDGKIIQHGTWFGECSELMICETKDFKATKVLRYIRL